MAASDLVDLSGLMDDATCFAFVRQHRWPEGGRCRKRAGAPGRGTLEKDKPPILGLIQRGGQVVRRMLATAWSRTLTGGLQGMPLFWNIRRA